MKRLLGSVTFAAVALATLGSASATTVLQRPLFAPDPLLTVATFDSPTSSGYQFVVTGALASGVYGPGLDPGVAAPPFGDSTKFYAVLGGSAGSNFVTFESDNSTPLALTAFRFDVSSLDAYNTITFLDKNGNTVDSFTGQQLTDPPGHANGDQFSTVTSLRLIFFNFSAPVAEVKFQSTQNSFEIDNVGVGVNNINPLGGPAPEPTTWMMLLTGFGVLGLALRSRGLGSVFAGV